ncbi:YheU family protein [Thalassomonas haliotis]|uniref:YheU family protein n=1 Tax=Thalassomonas haliotis TaxID=485448 RepID=A0ABY7VDY6_9GAMM|nr:YheU family protein [Thalassomonas haliotis]WDE11617.1 YheU family protein [Thalassomonas haliotis]
MIIPPDKLSPEVLAAVIEEFVLREGTEYGAVDIDLPTKIAQVKKQLAEGSALLVYSELYESVNIMPAEQFNAATHE